MLRRRSVVAGVVCALLGVAAGAAVASAAAWITYHHDAARSGIDADSTSPLTPSRAWQSAALDGPVWAEPLVYGSLVYVVTENDTVYALDASTGAIVWRTHVATAVPSAKLPCGDIGPTVGVTSTPVIDPTTGQIYVVADTWDGSNAAHELYGLNLSSGSVAVGPVGVDPPGSVPLDQLQRAALALDAGKVIIGYGGNDGDCGTYHGWLVAVPEGGGSLQTFEVDGQPGDGAGAIWGSGNAPAIDSANDIWIATGNGNSGTNFDYSESVIKLSSNVGLVDWWAPTNWSSLDRSDTDLGSTMPLLLANTGLVFEIGKEGVGYLLSQTNLGHAVGAPLYQAQVCSGSWGGGIYVNGVIYVACSDGMHALALNNDTFAPVSGWAVTPSAVAPPIFAGGLVWSAGYNDGVLYGMNPTTGATVFSASLGGFEHFTTPSAGGGLLFVANRTGRAGAPDQVTAFRIANPPPTPPPPPGLPTPPPPPGSGTPPKQLPPAPTIARLRGHTVRGKLQLSLRLSESAQLTVVVSNLAPGREVRGRCLARARHGRRCQAVLRKHTLHTAARKGWDALRPRMRALPAGRYSITVIATNSVGEPSRPQTVVIVVGRRG